MKAEDRSLDDSALARRRGGVHPLVTPGGRFAFFLRLASADAP